MSEPMEAERVMTYNPEFSDEPLSVDDTEGLREAVKRIQDAAEGEEYVLPDGMVNYKVYWNEPTESVRIGVLAMGASYEVRDSE